MYTRVMDSLLHLPRPTPSRGQDRAVSHRDPPHRADRWNVRGGARLGWVAEWWQELPSHPALGLLVLLSVLVVGRPGPAAAQVPAPHPLADKHVLVLHPFEPSVVPIGEATDHGIRAALDAGGGRDPEPVL